MTAAAELETRPRTDPVLVTGATGRVGRLVVDELLRAGVSVRALTRRPDQAALPPAAEVVVGDLTVPTSLDAALQGVGAVFLVWTAARDAAAALVARLASNPSGQRRR
ncbi:MAG: SDR family oxidoreductase, partial [Gemmatimonadaceae bacterium]